MVDRPASAALRCLQGRKLDPAGLQRAWPRRRPCRRAGSNFFLVAPTPFIRAHRAEVRLPPPNDSRSVGGNRGRGKGGGGGGRELRPLVPPPKVLSRTQPTTLA